jgi:transposase InsO family protein
VPDVVRKLGVTEQTYYRWKREYGGLRTDQAKRLKDLEKEHARLRRRQAVEHVRDTLGRDVVLTIVDEFTRECLAIDEARAVTEAWREDYNRVRPHGALGNRTPSEFARPVAGHAQLPALHG